MIDRMRRQLARWLAPVIGNELAPHIVQELDGRIASASENLSPVLELAGKIDLMNEQLSELRNTISALSPRPAPVFLGDRVVAQTNRGHVVYLKPQDHDLTPSIALWGHYEPSIEDTIVSLLHPGATAIDVGSNIGYHTVAMAAAVGPQGHVYTFEANPELLPLLYATVYSNNCSSWVSIHAKAALDRAGIFRLAADPIHCGSGHIIIDDMPASDYGTTYSVRTEVPAVTLDGELADRVEQVDLIHLDVEGSEALALYGAARLIARSPRLNIVTEWAVGMMAARSDVRDFIAWLVGFGFSFQVIEPSGELTTIDPSRAIDLPHCDLLLSRNEQT